MKYSEFLAAKGIVDPPTGMEAAEVNRSMFEWQADIVRWALSRGRAAIFADCGLGKTLMQLEWAHQVHVHTGQPVLVLAPLAVAQQTVREGGKFGIDAEYRRDGEVSETGITVTNYEMLVRFDAAVLAGVVLDESSILKAYDGKTRTEIIETFRETPFRLACTATPAPNDHMELGNHAEFLGVMTRAEMLAMFFVHDGGETQKWRLKGHAEDAFWRWMCSWAVMLRKPSDLGYPDDGFELPPLEMHEHVVSVGTDGAQRRGLLFEMEAKTLQERRAARKASIEERVACCARMVNASDEPWLIWCDLNAEGDALTQAIEGAEQVAGSDDNDTKSARMMGFTEGVHRVLVTKPQIAGFGMNWQHCPNQAFVGLSDSYERFYQAIRRSWRFGQRNPVHAHIIISEAEGSVLANIQRKEEDAARMAEGMVKHMSEISQENIRGMERVRTGYTEDTIEGDGWTMHQGDCVEVVGRMESESVHYTVFSPPFASLYTYSNSDRDMGNAKDHDEFHRHFRFLVEELLRVTKPGRLCSFHCMNLPTSKAKDGVIGLVDFRGILIQAFIEAGWIYHSEVVIWKDPVTAMQRTKALGLLHKQLKKDSCMSRMGIPDYLVTMRKPGENAERVEHDNESFPVKVWQQYASPVWDDINPSDTLQFRSAREDKDERHICPLQLEVTRRSLKLWSNPGDLVLSPFAGIGSEGYVAIEQGRRFVGVELKPSYYQQAVRNLAAAQPDAAGQQIDMFGDAA